MPSPARYNESANLYIISVERFRQLVSLPIVYVTGLPGSCDWQRLLNVFVNAILLVSGKISIASHGLQGTWKVL